MALAPVPPLLLRFHSIVGAYLSTPQAPAPAPRPGADQAQISDEAFLTGLYRELLGRDPDPAGFALHLGNLKGGTSRAFIRQAFLSCAEYQARQASLAAPAALPAPAPAPTPAPAPVQAAQPAAKVGPLSLAEYPKANPVGMHGLPAYLSGPDDVAFVLDHLQKVGARNTLLIVPFPDPAELRDVDRQFLAEAAKRGITVQIRLGFGLKPGDDRVDPAALERFTRQVAEVQGHGPYLEIANEPNLHGEWANDARPDARRFAAWWARYADAVSRGGGYPGLPGMAAGAYDTPDGGAKNEFSFSRAMLETLQAEHPASLDRAWTAAHPYHMYADAGHADFVEDGMWQLGQFNDLNRQILGRSLPVLVTESGWVDGENSRRMDPNNGSQAEDLARFKGQLARRPDWLLVGTADWLLSNRHGESWKGIYGPNGEATAWSRVLEARKGGWENLTDDRPGVAA